MLEKLISLYPAPAFIRSNNGPGFIAQALRNWCELPGVNYVGGPAYLIVAVQ